MFKGALHNTWKINSEKKNLDSLAWFVLASIVHCEWGRGTRFAHLRKGKARYSRLATPTDYKP